MSSRNNWFVWFDRRGKYLNWQVTYPRTSENFPSLRKTLQSLFLEKLINNNWKIKTRWNFLSCKEKWREIFLFTGELFDCINFTTNSPLLTINWRWPLKVYIFVMHKDRKHILRLNNLKICHGQLLKANSNIRNMWRSSYSRLDYAPLIFSAQKCCYGCRKKSVKVF